jgi:hypothetical protein
LKPCGSAGVSGGTAQAVPAASPARNAPSGFESLIVSVCPRATTPESPRALPVTYRSYPSTPLKADGNGAFMRGLATRSIVDLNVAAVTGWLEGGEKRKLGRIVKV